MSELRHQLYFSHFSVCNDSRCIYLRVIVLTQTLFMFSLHFGACYADEVLELSPET